MFRVCHPSQHNGREVWPIVEGARDCGCHQPCQRRRLGRRGGIGTVSAVEMPTAMMPMLSLNLSRAHAPQTHGTDPVRDRGAVQRVKGVRDRRRFKECDQHQRALGNGRRAARADVLGAPAAWSPASPAAQACPISSARSRPPPQRQLSADCRLSRAFRLNGSAPIQTSEWLAAVVYEDPWLAGGRGNLSTPRGSLKPAGPYPRVRNCAR